MAYEYDEITVYACHTVKTETGGVLIPQLELYATCERLHRRDTDAWEVGDLWIDEAKTQRIKRDGNVIERAIWAFIPDLIEADQKAIEDTWWDEVGRHEDAA